VKFVARHRVRAIEIALLAFVLVASAAVMWPPRTSDVPVDSAIDSLAIVPFANRGGNADGEYLSDGLTEGLIDSFSQVPRLKVAARSTVFPLKDRPLDPRAIGKDLNVRGVLLGSVSPIPAGLSLDVELVDAQDGHRIWSSKYETRLADLPAMRNRIVRDVAEQLRLPLAGDERNRLARLQTENGEAYQLYLKGRYVWNKRTEEGFRQGLDYFRQALEKDPSYALAHAGIADCYNLLGIWGALPPREAMPRVKDAALKAIAIDDSLAEAHTSLAFVYWVYDWDWTGAAAEFQRALDLNPNYATAHDWYAYYLASMGRFEEAIGHITRAQAIEPVSLSIGADVGELYYWWGRYDRAVAQLQGVLQVEPGFAMARNILGLTYLKMGRVDEAVKELEAAERLATGPRMLSTLGYAYGVSGSPARSRRILGELRRLSGDRYTSAFTSAVVYAGLGDTGAALDHLQQAFDERSDTMAILRVYPPLDGLRGDPRFQALLARVGHVDSPSGGP
jgi:TolB-like protein/Tfp pilus assembly protein PilF